MNTSKKSDSAAHPGTVLLEQFMKPKGIKPQQLSYALKVPVLRIHLITRERRAITPDTALRLAQYFCTTPEFWLDLQRNYDLKQAALASGDAIRKEVPSGCK